MDTGVCPKIFTFLTSSHPGVYVPAMRIIGNFSTGNEHHTNILIENDFLDIALGLLDHQKLIVRKEVCWILSNIAAGTDLQVLELLKKDQLIHKLVDLIQHDRYDIRSEILWIFANLERAGIP